MIYFNNDYSEGCHQKVLDALIATNMVQTFGYGEDEYCAAAAAKIKALCGREDVAVHFLVGGTQTNLTVIAAALRPHQGALCPVGGHINVHETGAVEATGHKVLACPSDDGKITADQVRNAVLSHRADGSFETETVEEMTRGYRTSTGGLKTAGEVIVADYKVSCPMLLTELETGTVIEMTDYTHTFRVKLLKMTTYNWGTNLWLDNIKN